MRVKVKSIHRNVVSSHSVKLSSTAFNSCPRCGVENMSSIGAHAAFKVRDRLNAGDRNEQQSSQFSKLAPTNHDLQDNPPAKYNGKLMNSIWGMYNRYSVHNIKSHIAYDKA